MWPEGLPSKIAYSRKENISSSSRPVGSQQMLFGLRFEDLQTDKPHNPARSV
jgi:hypothetical protein